MNSGTDGGIIRIDADSGVSTAVGFAALGAGGVPHHLAVSANQRRAYVTYLGAPFTGAFDLDPANFSNTKLAGLVATGTGSEAVHDPALHKSGKFLYVSNAGAGKIQVVNTETLTVVQSVTDGAGTHELAYNGRTDTILAGSLSAARDTVNAYAVDPITGILNPTALPMMLMDGGVTGKRPWECVWMNSVDEAYCAAAQAAGADGGGGWAEIWHIAAGGSTRAIVLADASKPPNEVATDATDSKLYVAVGSGVNIYDIQGTKKIAPTLITTLDFGAGASSHGLSLGPGNRSMYVTNKVAGSVGRIDVATDSIAAVYTGLGVPEGLVAMSRTPAAKGETVTFVNSPATGATIGRSTDDGAVTTVDLAGLGLPGVPHHVQTTSIQSRAYVTFFNPARLGVVSLGATPAKVAEIEFADGGTTTAHDVAITSDNRWVFASSNATNQIFSIKTADNTAMVAADQTGNPDLLAPHEVAFDPKTQQLMVGSLSSAQGKVLIFSVDSATGMLSKVNSKTVTLDDGTNMGLRPWECRWLRTAEEGYCSVTHMPNPDAGSPMTMNTVWYVKPGAATGAATAALMLGATETPNDVITNLDDTRLYVAFADKVTVYDISTNRGAPTQVAQVTVGAAAHGLELSPNGKSLYATAKNGNQVVRIDTATNTIANTLTTNVSVPEGLVVH
ncbi:MAG: beta-propeller fold lactonase family protein [Myxococcales bacterium]|nr:beta-propeller fold lactonase family protein [Myxococcales bacterium]